MKIENVEMGVVVKTEKLAVRPELPKSLFAVSWSGKVVKVMPRAKVVVIEFIAGQIRTGREQVRIPFGTEVEVVEGAKEFFSSFGTYKF